MGGGPQANSFSVEPTQGVGSLLHLAAAEDDLSIQVPLAETILFPRSVWCHVLLCTHHACANHTPTHMHAYTTLRTYAHVHIHSGKCVIDMYRFPDTPSLVHSHTSHACTHTRLHVEQKEFKAQQAQQREDQFALWDYDPGFLVTAAWTFCIASCSCALR